MAGDGVDQLLRVALLLEQLQRLAGMAGVEVGVALVVEVVQQAGGRPQLLVFAPLARVGDHAGLDPQEVLAQRVALHPLGDQVPGFFARRFGQGEGRLSGIQSEPEAKVSFGTLASLPDGTAWKSS